MTHSKKQKQAIFNGAVLNMIRAERFNAFDGERIARALDENRQLWDAAWWDMQGPEDPALKVLDPVRGDTLYLRAKGGNLNWAKLDKLVGSFKASNIASREVDGKYVVAAWWD